MLTQNPSIKSLHIEDAQFDLTDFALERQYDRQSYPEELTQMVCSRWWLDESDEIRKKTSNGLVRLQKLTLQGFFKDTDVAVISDLSKSGLDVIFN
ncbi:hypothetical protein BT96DRAFT_919853 [Gymnopus androsaceus JB14]|uniref:Uncharacterized protein n=1 Tax=Gymnopus androsaceus JB14 TaxID=1447944 RepID=A0A6A4HP52_9AGAR|nr:hypothetical protein BT96DRAFT_919853 [Gymnopus androsaceus JB14]